MAFSIQRIKLRGIMNEALRNRDKPLSSEERRRKARAEYLMGVAFLGVHRIYLIRPISGLIQMATFIGWIVSMRLSISFLPPIFFVFVMLWWITDVFRLHLNMFNFN